MYNGSVWYESVAGPDGWWLMTRSRPELALAYIGTVEKLRQAVAAIAAKKPAVITAVRHRDPQGFEAYGQTAAQHNLMRGSPPPLWRLKATLDMPSVTISLIERPSDPSWVVGLGAGTAEDLPPLIAALKDPQMSVRADAADELRLFGKEARSAVPALKAALADPVPVVGIRAAAALGWIDPGNVDAVTRLTALATAAHGPRREAIEALGDLGPAAKKAVLVLRGLLSDREMRVRAAATESLGLIGPDAASAVSDLLPLLDDKNLRSLAAEALGQIGPGARAAIPHLTATLRRDPVEVNWVFAVALIRIEPAAAEPAIPLLLRALESADERTRWDARWFFGALGPTTEKAVPNLLALLAHSDDKVRWDATRVLATLGKRLQPHVPRFIELAGSERRTDRLRAYYLLRSTGSVAAAAIPILEKELQNTDREVQTAAREALRAIQRK
jgi:HEAT repeat protein